MHSNSDLPGQQKFPKSLASRIFGTRHTLPSDVVESFENTSGESYEPLELWIEGDCPQTQKLSACDRQKIETRRFTIGRRRSYIDGNYDAVADMLLAQNEPFTVSRMHCAIETEGQGVVVRDLGSRLGTLVNDVRIGGKRGESDHVMLDRGEHSIVLGPRKGGHRLRLIVS